MANNPYTPQTISGYNSSPPSDDGSATAANEVKWATHKTKLGDPVKTLSEGIDDAVSTAFDVIHLNAVNTQATTYVVQLTDRGKMVTADGTFTIALPAAATAGEGFEVTIKNIGSGTITIDGDSSETIDGVTTMTIEGQYDAVNLMSDGSNWNSVSFGAKVIDGGRIIMGSDAQGDLLIRGASEYGRLGVGTDLQVLQSDGTDPAWATPIFTKAATSGLNAITSSGLITYAHGLGAEPTFVQFRIKCNDAGGDGGFAQDDEMIVGTTDQTEGSAATRGFSAVVDSTNVSIRYGSSAAVFTTINFTDGNNAVLTNSKWDLIIKAWV